MTGNSRWAAAKPHRYTDTDPERPAACYCGATAVMIPKAWIGRQTRSCGSEECNRLALIHIALKDKSG